MPYITNYRLTTKEDSYWYTLKFRDKNQHTNQTFIQGVEITTLSLIGLCYHSKFSHQLYLEL